MGGKVRHAGSGWAVSRVPLTEGGGASPEPLPPAFRSRRPGLNCARARPLRPESRGPAPGVASVAQPSPRPSRRASPSSEVRRRGRLGPGRRRRAEPSFVIQISSLAVFHNLKILILCTPSKGRQERSSLNVSLLSAQLRSSEKQTGTYLSSAFHPSLKPSDHQIDACRNTFFFTAGISKFCGNPRL